MGVKVKGGMYCQRCDKPVAAQKSTHRARGAASIATGLWPFALPDDYHCPDCGGLVVSERLVNPSPSDVLGQKVLVWVVIIIFVLLFFASLK